MQDREAWGIEGRDKMSVYVDLNRCIGCRACEVACRRVHEGLGRITADTVDDRAAVPLSCRQCEKAACAMTCYAKALVQEEDGLSFDPERCTGCGLCVLACPFGLIYGEEPVRRCDLCPDLDLPACVETCPSQALIYGDDATAVIRRRAAAAIATSRRYL